MTYFFYYITDGENKERVKSMKKRRLEDVCLRPYRPGDAKTLAKIFYDTIHAVNIRDYTPSQVDAWATGTVDEERWEREMLARCTVIAERNGQILGFGDMREDGYLDRLFIHKDFQRRGLASAICDALEREVGAPCFTTHASLTARPFFQARGYTVVKAQTVERRGVELPNFVMEKRTR